MTDSPEVLARHISKAVWNAACHAANGAPEQVTDEGWQALIDAGLAVAPGVLEEHWAGLIEGYLNSPITVRATATYDQTAADISMSVGRASVCVIERSQLGLDADGAAGIVATDPLLDVAMTTGHPWLLLRRGVPPLATLQAAPQQTTAATAKPVSLDPATRASLAAYLAEHPDGDLVAAVRASGDERVRELLAADGAMFTFFFAMATDPVATGRALYIGTPEHLYRATSDDDAPWEEVAAGDLAFSFQWFLMGAGDILASATR